MAARLLHVVDHSASEDALAHLSLLIDQLPPSRFTQSVLAIGRPASVLRLPPGVRIRQVQGTDTMPGLHAMRVLEVLRWRSSELVLMWDVLQRMPIGDDGSGPPYVAILANMPRIADLAHWRMVTRKHGLQSHFVCLSDSIRQELTRTGVPSEKTQIIRPSADQTAIRHPDRLRIRAELGLPADARVLLTACPTAREGGQYVAAWAAAILHQIWPDVRMILPGGFREDRRARRLSEECYCPQVFRVAGEHYGPADLLAASDMLVWPDSEDSPTGWLAWAMAAGVPIVATGSPSVRELIRDGQTGFLVDSARPHALATRIRMAWEDTEARQRCVQEAGHHAYEMFRPQKCLDAYLSLVARFMEVSELGTLPR